jgi:hypothetical protein
MSELKSGGDANQSPTHRPPQPPMAGGIGSDSGSGSGSSLLEALMAKFDRMERRMTAFQSDIEQKADAQAAKVALSADDAKTVALEARIAGNARVRRGWGSVKPMYELAKQGMLSDDPVAMKDMFKHMIKYWQLYCGALADEADAGNAKFAWLAPHQRWRSTVLGMPEFAKVAHLIYDASNDNSGHVVPVSSSSSSASFGSGNYTHRRSHSPPAMSWRAGRSGGGGSRKRDRDAAHGSRRSHSRSRSRSPSRARRHSPPRSSGAGGGGKRPYCYHCKQYGHWRNECGQGGRY